MRSSLLILILLATGCGGASETPPDQAADDPKSAPVTEAAAASLDLQAVDADQYAAQIGQFQGKVVVVDFWASWCEPCMELFPHTVELSRKYPDSVVFASMSMDLADSHEAARTFLAKQGETSLHHWRMSYDRYETGFERFDIRGGIPFYKLYDRHGKLRYELGLNADESDRTLSVDELEIRIRELLAETDG